MESTRSEPEVAVETTIDTANTEDTAAGVGNRPTVAQEGQDQGTPLMNGDGPDREMASDIHTRPAGEMIGAIRRGLDVKPKIIILVGGSDL